MSAEELPRAHVRRRRLFRLSWVIPLVAAIIAGWLVWQHLQRQGLEITVSFNDVSGLRVGQTPVKYRGVQVGEVVDMRLSEDQKQALVRIQLHHLAAGIAREGARFWIVRPRVGWGAVSGLSTVFTGPEIQVLPSDEGPRAFEFAGLEAAPVGLESDGLRLTLRATRPPRDLDAVLEDARGFDAPGMHLEYSEALERTHRRQRPCRHAMPVDLPVGTQVPQEPAALLVGEASPQRRQLGPQHRQDLAPVTARRLDLAGPRAQRARQARQRR